ncbi:MAG: DUF3052 domain-containing protein [Actinobacteria bacterium]|nr:DUF3052 domain-containing protein [Actinomycetota bacterium]
MTGTGTGTSALVVARRLGIQPGARLALVSAPASFRASVLLPADVELRTSARGRVDVLVFFATRRAELARRFPTLARAVQADGGLWIAWPKRTAGIASDLAESSVRALGRAAGLVDVRTSVIDASWSALRFEHRAAGRR